MTLPVPKFDTAVFHVIDRDGQPWLRGADIARALGHSREDAISRAHQRNADEFTAEMSQTVDLTVSQYIYLTRHAFAKELPA